MCGHPVQFYLRLDLDTRLLRSPSLPIKQDVPVCQWFELSTNFRNWQSGSSQSLLLEFVIPDRWQGSMGRTANLAY